MFVFFKQKTSYELRISDWSSDVCSSDLDAGVTFRYKDYRKTGAGRQQVMTLAADEFIRRFLLHALPRGFHRIRHYGLLASAHRKDHLERARRLLDVAPPPTDEPADDAEPRPT